VYVYYTVRHRYLDIFHSTVYVHKEKQQPESIQTMQITVKAAHECCCLSHTEIICSGFPHLTHVLYLATTQRFMKQIQELDPDYHPQNIIH